MNEKREIKLLFFVFALHGLFLFVLSFLGSSIEPPKVPMKVEIFTYEEKALPPLVIEELKALAVEEAKLPPPPEIVPPEAPVEAPCETQTEESAAPEEPAPVEPSPPPPPPPPPPPKEKPKVTEVKKEAPKKKIVETKKKSEKAKPVSKKESKPASATVKKATAKKNPTKSPSVAKSSSTPNPAKNANQEKLLSLMQSSLNQIEGCEKKSGKGVASGSGGKAGNFSGTIPTLKSEGIVISGGPPSYSNELTIYLKHQLTLPEKGDVKVKLTLSEQGKVVALAILSSSSEKNRTYVEKRVPSLHFPPLPSVNQETFLLTLKGE